MAKKKLQAKIVSYGIYTPWDRQSKRLPDILEYTTVVPNRLDIEFGYIINIKQGRGEKLTFCIEHPPFKNSAGDVAPAFTGEVYVRHSDFNFFLGDTIWAPVADKVGPWQLTTLWNDDIIAKKTINVVPEDQYESSSDNSLYTKL
ncbi:MAG: DUF3859 domain-containing protein [Phycisphaerae bacterium]|nr:DUF3859 domain-containing protein [Phycisphaerae bacterium]